MEDKICNLIKSFFDKKINKICPNKEEQCDFQYEIYNEFSLQHELGIYLREVLGNEYKILFEKNVKYICEEKYKDYDDWQKKEIDIVVLKQVDKKWVPLYALELKFPPNEAYPKRMSHFIEDMKFMEQVKARCTFEKTYCLTLTNNPNFYSDKNGRIKNTGIYCYFRNNNIVVPPNEKITCNKKNKTVDIVLDKIHKTYWQTIRNSKNVKYYIDIIK